MSVTTIANRYARALADVITERGEMNEVVSDLNGFAGLMSGHDQLRDVFASPVLSLKRKRGVLNDLLARLAIVPLVLEARGLDVTPVMIDRMTRFGDAQTASVLQTIYDDEIGHVAIGSRWFHYLCARRGAAPQETWRALVATYFKGALMPPFNDAARAQAGLPRGYYATGA